MDRQYFFKLLSASSLSLSEIIKIIEGSQIPAIDFCNSMALFIAEHFIENPDSFKECNLVLNNLFQFMASNDEIQSVIFPEPASSVYTAFDEGEYNHENDSNNVDPVLKYTVPMINEVLKKYG